jgi:hypothetical protein
MMGLPYTHEKIHFIVHVGRGNHHHTKGTLKGFTLRVVDVSDRKESASRVMKGSMLYIEGRLQ